MIIDPNRIKKELKTISKALNVFISFGIIDSQSVKKVDWDNISSSRDIYEFRAIISPTLFEEDISKEIKSKIAKELKRFGYDYAGDIFQNMKKGDEIGSWLAIERYRISFGVDIYLGEVETDVLSFLETNWKPLPSKGKGPSTKRLLGALDKFRRQI